MSATKLDDLKSRWLEQIDDVSSRSNNGYIMVNAYADKLIKRITGKAIRTARKLWEIEDARKWPD